MKRCLLIGYYGHSNLGDDLLFMEALSKIPLDYHIYIEASDNAIFPSIGDRDIIRIDNRKRRQCYYDLILLNGGGLFPSKQYGIKNLITYTWLFFRSKKIIINGIGVVPKKGVISNLLFSIFLRMTSYISVRDNVSKQYVNKLLWRNKCINCHDLYFGRELLPVKLNCMDYKREGLLVCVANPFSDDEKKDPNTKARYNKLVKQLQDAIFYLSTNYTKNKVTFLPFFQGSDNKLINDIQSDRRLHDSYVLTVGKDFNIDKIDAIFSHYKLGFCMRFHSFVLAIRNCLPFVGICYDYKSESLIEEAGLGYVGVRYGIRKTQFFGIEKDLDDEELSNAIDKVVGNYSQIGITMNRIRHEYHDSVLQNYQKIYKLI